jgi:hypothetical protein
VSGGGNPMKRMAAYPNLTAAPRNQAKPPHILQIFPQHRALQMQRHQFPRAIFAEY